MKVLLLSCNTGEGHNACCRAIAERLQKANIPCDTIDALSCISPGVSHVLSASHKFVYRYFPHMSHWGYFFTDSHPILYQKGTPFYSFMQLGSRNLAEIIEDGGYDTIICTHVWAGIILREARRKCQTPLRTYFLATDYTCSPIAETGEADIYMIPDRRVQKAFTEKQIPQEKLYPVGIPIADAFYHPVPKEEAKSAVGIPATHTHLVIMCGSMGCGPLRQIVAQLAEKIEPDMDVTVVCGNNEKLRQSLLTIVEKTGCDRIHVRGYENRMPLLLDSADVYLTKPGGISVTEAAVKGVPMVLIQAVGGCESGNFQLFTESGAAMGSRKADEVTEMCLNLLQDPQKRAAQSRGYKELLRHGADAILRLLQDESCIVMLGDTDTEEMLAELE